MSPLPYTLLASNSAFASQALHTLCLSGQLPVAIAMLASSPATLPVYVRPAAGEDVIGLALLYHIPLLPLPADQPDDWPALLSFGTESCLLSTCFPALIPNPLVSRTACFNLHPSLLPAYRGPAPLFWQFHSGEHHTGVTLHRVSTEFDCGDIVSSQRFELAPGIRLGQIASVLACAGARLFLNLLQTWRPGQALDCQPQDSSMARYDSFPDHKAYTISPYWTIDRALRFVQGVANNNRVFHYRDKNHQILFQNIRTNPDPSPAPHQTENKQSCPVQLADGGVVLLNVQADFRSPTSNSQ